MNTETRTPRPAALARALGLAAMLLGGIAAPAGASGVVAPTADMQQHLARSVEAKSEQLLRDAEIEACLDHAGEHYAFGDAEMRVVSAGRFTLDGERHMVAISTEIHGLGRGVTPRLYCTVNEDGRIGSVQSMPRLPARPAALVVAK